MQVTATSLPEVLIIEPKVFGDERGFFFESFNRKIFADAVGLPADFVQDNQSRSAKGVLRGLHYQIHNPQGKLVRVVRGSVFNVAVDVRKAHPISAVGSELNSVKKTILNCGCPRVSRMVF